MADERYAITCECGTRLVVRAEHFGRRGRCKQCSRVLEITEANAERLAGASSSSSLSKSQMGRLEKDAPGEWRVDDVLLGLYRVTALLGEGGMGKVHKVRHLGWHMDLAVKSPRAKFFKTEAQKENFIRECDTWIHLDLHPQIVSCYYVRALGGIPRVFVEYVPGGNLNEWVTSRKLYEGGPEKTIERIVDIAVQFAWGLHYAHERGLIHQDVKTSNVMMTLDGIAKVTDFGLANARAASGEHGEENALGEVVVKYSGMTPAYCSPEQAHTRTLADAGVGRDEWPRLTRRTDIYSWAVSVFEMFYGGVTWKSGILVGSIFEDYRRSGQADPERQCAIPDSMASLLQRCLATEPNDRPRDLLEAAAELKAIYAETTGEPYLRDMPEPSESLADSLNNRAVSMLDLGKQDEALDYLEDARKKDPHHIESAYNQVVLLARLGRDTNKALITRMSEVCATRPDDWLAKYMLAKVHLQLDEPGTALDILKTLPEDCPETDAVQATRAAAETARSRPPLIERTFEGHRGEVLAVRLTRDGQCAVSGSSDGTLRVWEVGTGRCLRTLEGHEGWVNDLWLSPDDRYAMSASADKSVRLWELATGRCVRTFLGHTAGVEAVCMSRNGRYALSGSEDKTLRLWVVANGRCERTFEGSGAGVNGVCLASDDRFALSAGGDKALRLWEVSSGCCLRILEGHDQPLRAVCLSNDDRLAFTSSMDETVRVWDLSARRCMRTLRGHEGRVNGICLMPDGRSLVSGSTDRTAKLWNTTTGRCLRTFEGHRDAVRAVCCSADGRCVLSGSADHALRLWNARVDEDCLYLADFHLCRVRESGMALSAQRAFRRDLSKAEESLEQGDAVAAAEFLRRARSQPGCHRHVEALEKWEWLYLSLPRADFSEGWEARTLEGHQGWALSVCVSPDGRYVLSGSRDNTSKLWDPATGQCLRTLEGHENRVRTVTMSGDGRYALSGSNDNTLKLWEVETGRCVYTFTGNEHNVQSACLSYDARLALSGAEVVRVWQVSPPFCLRAFEGQTDIIAVCLSPDARFALSAGSHDKAIRLWDVATGRFLSAFEGHEGWIRSVCMSADGQYALSGSNDKTLKFWEVATGRCLRTLVGHENWVRSVCMTADGGYALSGSDDKTVRLWEVATGRCLRTFEGHTSSVQSVAVSPDGRFAVSAANDNAIRLWTLVWDLENRQPADWAEAARPYLETFLRLHTPVPERPLHGAPPPDGTLHAIAEDIRPTWTEDDFEQLLYLLDCAGFGFLIPEGVRHQLDVMADFWPARSSSFVHFGDE